MRILMGPPGLAGDIGDIGDDGDLLARGYPWPEAGPWTEFTAPNSLREVEAGANLLLREDDPSDDPHSPYPDPPESPDENEMAGPASEDEDTVDTDVDPEGLES